MPERPADDDPRQPPPTAPQAAATERMDRPTPSEPTIVGGRYEVRDRLGAGGMCDVWRAHDPVLDREVAVKQLLPRWRDETRVRERFTAEALRVAKLSHPAIVGVLDAGEDASGPFLVMELVDGPPLDVHLARHGRMDAVDVIPIGIAVAQGLGAAHRAGITHRDVKPGNILLDPRHGARLTDFGIAKATADVDMTATGEIIGTAAYLAPEQAMGQVVDARSDVYALGCVLFECLTGERPFRGDTPVQTASARIGVQVHLSDRMEGVPPDVEHVISIAMAPDPQNRWGDGQALAAALNSTGLRTQDSSGGRPLPSAAAAQATATQRMPMPGAAAGRDGGAAGHADGGGGWADDRSWGEERGWEDGPVPQVLPAAARTPRDSRRGEIVTAIVALLGLLVAVALTRPSGGDDQAASAQTTEEEGAGAAVDAGPLTGLALTSFDPLGGGDENDDLLPLLVDGDASTAWTTVGYNSAAFGNLKPGVGVILDLGQDVTVDEVRLLGMPAGQSVELRTASAAPASLDDTTVIARSEGLGTEAAIRPSSETTTRHLIVWLVPDLPPDGGRFRGAIGEIQVFGS